MTTTVLECLPDDCIEKLTQRGISKQVIIRLFGVNLQKLCQYVPRYVETSQFIYTLISPYIKNNPFLSTIRIDEYDSFPSRLEYLQHLINVLNSRIPIQEAKKALERNEKLNSQQKPQQNKTKINTINYNNNNNIKINENKIENEIKIYPNFYKTLHPFYIVEQIMGISNPKRIIKITAKQPLMFRLINSNGIDRLNTVEINKREYKLNKDQSEYYLPVELNIGNYEIKSEDSLVLFKGRKATTEEIIQRLIKEMKEEGRILKRNEENELISKEIISLRCQLSLCKYKYPVKMKECKHEWSLDLYSLIERIKIGYWNCMCKVNCTLKNIYIDEWLQKIVEESPEDAYFVEIENGKVTKYLDEDKNEIGKQQKKTKEMNSMILSQPSQSNKKIDIICLDDSEEETKENENEMIETYKIEKLETNTSETIDEIIEIQNKNNENEEEIFESKIEWDDEITIQLNWNELLTNENEIQKMDEDIKEVYLEVWNSNIPDDIQIKIWKERGYNEIDIEKMKNVNKRNDFNINELDLNEIDMSQPFESNFESNEKLNENLSEIQNENQNENEKTEEFDENDENILKQPLVSSTIEAIEYDDDFFD